MAVSSELILRAVRGPECAVIQALFRRGDTNVDGTTDLSDAVATLDVLFAPEQASQIPCYDSADSNDDGQIDISDAVKILLHLFSGSTIPDPGPDTCGSDPTPDELDCADYAACE